MEKRFARRFENFKRKYNMKDDAKELRLGRVSCWIILAAVLLALSTYLILGSNNVRNIRISGELLVAQIRTALERNQANEETLRETLKDSYMLRAKVVSYMLENHPEAAYDRAELDEIAQLMELDEIHLFDETGTIYAGTCPQYYGLSFDSGEQIGYFKPMLADKTLSMCQDMMPNTAEGKEMIYAITWNSAGDRMIQVGVAPVRLQEAMKYHEIPGLLEELQVYPNIFVYVADAETGEILGTTAKQAGAFLQEVGMEYSMLQEQELRHQYQELNGENCFCTIWKGNGYVIGVARPASVARDYSAFSLMLIVICLTIAVIVILIVLHRLQKSRKIQQEQLMTLISMSEIYYTTHLIDLKANSFMVFSCEKQIRDVIDQHSRQDADITMRAVLHKTIEEVDLEKALAFADLWTLKERLQGRKVIFTDLLGKNVGWIRMSFITISTDAAGMPEKVICTTQIIDEEKKREARLIQESNTDRLTGCLNRRAYEADLQMYREKTVEESFVFVSMDVNGLKTINDTLGHAAGDELLLGAVSCMQQVFGAYGSVYRIGGDEFAAIIFAEEEELKEIQEKFIAAVECWSGTLVQTLSVSAGYAAKREFAELTINEMIKKADEKMYEKKLQYYHVHGIERRRIL